jgi:hypothetical protein
LFPENIIQPRSIITTTVNEPRTAVYDDVNGRNRQNYGRIRPVNRTFHMRRITVVTRRVVYGRKRTSFTIKPVP